MIKINGMRTYPLIEALKSIANFLIEPGFDVEESNEKLLRVCARDERGKSFCWYEGEPGEMNHLLQLCKAILGKGMGHVPTPLVFSLNIARWDHLQGFKGDKKIKVALGMLGGAEHHPDDIIHFDLEHVLQAYAMHAEDPRVSMSKWLEMTHA